MARAGRESLFALDPQPLQELRQYLERVSADWDQALSRLKLFVEAENEDETVNEDQAAR